jgi:uncharacterized protein (DUF1697 family)
MNDRAARWAAFLRGINLGKRQVKMEALRLAMTNCGYTNVATILASGNVIFDDPNNGASVEDETRRLEACLLAAIGFPIDLILRSGEQLKALAVADPFAGIKITPDTRLYVSFLPAELQWDRPLPYEFPGGLRLLRTTGGDICSTLTISPTQKTTDAMAVLEKEFGKRITTRNWNTVEKVAKQLATGS